MSSSQGPWPFLFVAILAGALGAVVTYAVQYKDIVELQASKLKLGEENERLTQEKVEERQARVEAENQLKKARSAIYAKDTNAANWASKPIPKPISDRMRNASERLQESRETSGDK